MLGLVGLFGLAISLPEFLEARGLFLDVDDVGPRALVAFDDGYVVVGDDSNGGFVWFSADGSTWSNVDDPVFDDVDELSDVIAVEDGLIALGNDGMGEAVILVSADGLVWSEAARFGNVEYGTVGRAISQTDTAFVVITSTVFNDMEFYQSTDLSSWTVVEPTGVADDGEDGSDVACHGEVCVGVGFHESTFLSDLESDTGVAWINATGDRYDLVDHDFQSTRLTAITWVESGFLTVGDTSTGEGVVWQSPGGQDWNPVVGPFNEMTTDGASAIDNSYIIFGTNPTTNQLLIWTSDTGNQWDQETISNDFPEGSQIRSITHRNNTRIAVGIASDTLNTIIWISTNNQPWQHTATLETTQTG